MVEVSRAQRPFWMHQVVEYIVGIALISVSLQLPDPGVPAVMGLAIVVNAAIVVGPAGAFRLVGRSAHKWMDVVLMALLLITAFQPWVSVESTARLMIGSIAVVLFFVWFHTDFADRAARKQRRAERARPGSEEIGKRAGQAVGDGVNSLKRWKRNWDESRSGPDDAAAGETKNR